MRLKKLLLVALVATMLALFACGKSAIEIEGTVSLKVGESVVLTANITGLDKTLLEWSSDNTDIATVDKDGKVTGIAEGETIVKASIGTFFATCTVKVLPADVDSELNAAITAKLANVPKAVDFDEQKYTTQSWQQFTEAIAADIAAIEAFATVAEVDAYVITASASMLEKNGRTRIAEYTAGWTESNAEVDWIGEPSFEDFEQALTAFETAYSAATNEEERFAAADAFLNTPNMSLRKAKEEAKNELRAELKTNEELYKDHCGEYWENVELEYLDGLLQIELASGAEMVSTSKVTAISDLGGALLIALKNGLAVSVDEYVDSLEFTDFSVADWQAITEIYDANKQIILGSTTIEQAIEAYEQTLELLDAVIYKLLPYIALIDYIQESPTDSGFAAEAYETLRLLTEDAAFFAELNAAVLDADKILASYLANHKNATAEAIVLRLMRTMYSGRLGDIPSTLSAAITTVHTLIKSQSQSALTTIISDVKTDFSAFDASGNYLSFVSQFEQNLLDHEQRLWELDWKDDYFLTITIDLDDGTIDGLTTDDLVFEVRLRYENDASGWRFNTARDAQLKALIEMADPSKDGYIFSGWQMQNEWYLHTVSAGEQITSASWREWDDIEWGSESKSYLTDIDFGRMSAGRFVSKIGNQVYAYPNMEVVVVANWTLSGGGDVSVEDFYGTWISAGGILEYTLVINSDGTASDSYVLMETTYSTNYSYTFQSGLIVLSLSPATYIRINQQGQIELAWTADFSEIKRVYDKQ